MSKAFLIWIDPDIQGSEYDSYVNQIKGTGKYEVSTFLSIEKAFPKIFEIKFDDTIIIISGKIYKDFFKKLQHSLEKLFVIPQIIIFCEYKDLLKIKKEEEPFPLFEKNFVFSNFSDVMKQLSIDNLLEYFSRNEKFIFEYCNSIESLCLPLNYHQLMSKPTNDEILKFNFFLHQNYLDLNNNDIIKLLNQTFKNCIPIELLVKYWLRLYSFNEFSDEVNKELREQIGNKFDVYVRLLYYSLNKRYIQPVINKNFFKGGIITNKEIDIINNFINNKKYNIPGAYCYSKIFLSFSLKREIALDLIKINKEKLKNDENLVLFQIETGNDYYDQEYCSNADISQMSYFPDREEVLFFPFSCFEVIQSEKKTRFEASYQLIRLRYLGKYRDLIPKNLFDCKNIPVTKFSQNIFKSTITDNNLKKIIIKNNPQLGDSQQHVNVTYNIPVKTNENSNIINKDSNNYDKNVTKNVKTTVIKGDGYTRIITITTTKTKYTTKNNDNKNNNINNEINDNVQPIVEESKNE